MDRLASQVIIDILASEMGFGSSNIWIRDQNKKIPNDDGFYAIVGMTDAVPISSNSNVFFDDPDMKERLTVQLKENIQIDIFSRSNDAITRRWEVIASLRSLFSMQQQEINGFKIMRLPNSFINSSVAEGGSQLNRYSITVGCMVLYEKIKILNPDNGDYYDDFDTRVDDEKTIGEIDGLIEFNITGD
tara:strand:+ start:855 stop:1418 length:564 start_codon:yes stop_codon:yes gene_type:complete